MSLINKIDSYFNCCDFSIYDGLSYSSDSLFISTKNIGDALIVAKAAIDRLLNNPFEDFKDLSNEIKSYINQCLWMVVPLSVNPSAPGQGALAIETKSNDKITNEIIKNKLNTAIIKRFKEDRPISLIGNPKIK